ncbi:MAG: hypothetical protein JKY48_04580 [Flavobacteriales bacterium]|nr:hypothetical protein [Flavobacteriales bacterium]
MEHFEVLIKNNYNAQILSTEQLKRILDSSGVRHKRKFSFPTQLKYAAIIILFLGSVFSIYLSQRAYIIVHDFATEVAYNHEKKLPPEIQTNSVNQLNQELNKLNFKIVLPERITGTMTLIGGRYCSVDNRIAAQLKLENQNSEIVTCYVFRKEETFDFDQEIVNKNVKVTIWNSDHLIYAIASDVNP